MTNASAVFRSLIVYGLCLPLAACLGYLLANPLDMTTMAVIGVVLLLLLAPLLLRWHHAWLIFTWNMTAVLFFLPGRPGVWMAMAAISLSIGIFQYALNRDLKFLYVPSVAVPLIFLTVVVLATAYLTGGIGLKAFGSAVYGGKNYVGIVAAVIAFFALTSRQIAPNHAIFYVSLFFLGTIVGVIGEFAWILPSQFNFLYLIFPVMDMDALTQQGTSVYMSTEAITRITGLCYPALGIFYAMLARYGIRGIFMGSKPWRFIVMVVMIGIGSLSGFRSIMIMFAMVFVVLFFMERLHRTPLLPIFAVAGLLAGALMVPFANRLPFTIQRSLAFLPIDIDPTARISAEVSSGWRVQMWKDVLPEIPKHLLLGKGYGFSGREQEMLFITGDSSAAVATMAGDYHNGPLSVIIPFGLFGAFGFCWFLWGGFHVVYHNYKFGDPAYRQANTFLFAYYFAKMIFFFVIFGALVADLLTFAGLVGLSISLNGGVAKPAVVAPQPKVVFNQLRLHPSARRPVGA